MHATTCVTTRHHQQAAAKPHVVVSVLWFTPYKDVHSESPNWAAATAATLPTVATAAPPSPHDREHIVWWGAFGIGESHLYKSYYYYYSLAYFAIIVLHAICVRVHVLVRRRGARGTDITRSIDRNRRGVWLTLGSRRILRPLPVVGDDVGAVLLDWWWWWYDCCECRASSSPCRNLLPLPLVLLSFGFLSAIVVVAGVFFLPVNSCLTWKRGSVSASARDK